MPSANPLEPRKTDLVVATRDDLKDALREVLLEHVTIPERVPLAAVLTTAQAADYLGATEAWVRAAAKEGRLAKAPASNSRRLLLTRASVDRLLSDG